MTSDPNITEPDDATQDAAQFSAPPVVEDIVSVNRKGSANNKLAKSVFLLLVGALLVGVLAWYGQNWANARKAQLKVGAAPKDAVDTKQVFNPEKTGTGSQKPKFGAESSLVPPSQLVAASAALAGAREDEIRPLRGADGKVMVNPQGRALGVDRNGKVVEVPAIAALDSDGSSTRKPLPGQGAGTQSQQKPASRYGGSLFVGEPAKPSSANAADSSDGGTAQARAAIAKSQSQQIADILRAAGVGADPAGKPGGAASAAASGLLPGASTAPSESARAGTVGAALFSSATPVALARRMSDQNLVLPKGRQADCVLTGRIIDEVPGFTSCVLAQNLYSDNGRVLLLERGSELTGEYGVTSQLGMERLFVTWSRLKTPEGIEIDLSSPGSDRLGTAGIPGYLDNRWGERIGAALLVSFIKDLTVAALNNATQAPTNVTVQTVPWQNTTNTTSDLAQEVIKQTLKVRPRLTINEGDRISIYVARDLDFSPVYELKLAGVAGPTRLRTP